MADKTLPNNVRELREAQLMSKAELARKAGLSPLTIDRVEGGKPCRMDTKRKIILGLGLKLSERHRVFPDDAEAAPSARAKAAKPGRDRAVNDADARGKRTASKGDAAHPGKAASEAARGADDDAHGTAKDDREVSSDLPKARYS